MKDRNMRPSHNRITPASIVDMQTSAIPMRDPQSMAASFDEMLDVVTRLYNLTGQVDLKAIMDRAALVKR